MDIRLPEENEKAQLDNLNAQTDLLRAQAELARAQAKAAASQIINLDAGPGVCYQLTYRGGILVRVDRHPELENS